MPGTHRKRQTTARCFQPVPCAILGCGDQAEPGCIYCQECRDRAAEPLNDKEARLLQERDDVDVVLLRERLAGKGPMMRRLKRQGTHPCGLCGRPSLPGRQYCSERCRTRARAGERSQVELDGTVATLLEHAARIGLGRSTVYKRLKLGMTPVEALTRPIDLEMRRSRS